MKLRNFKYNNLPKTKFRCAYAQLFRLLKAVKQKYVTKMMNVVLDCYVQSF